MEASVKSVLAALLREGCEGVSQLCRPDIIQEMIHQLEKTCTRKMQRRWKRGQARGKTENPDKMPEAKTDVAEVYSRPRMSAMAEKLGYTPGFALDIRTCDEQRRPWDLSVPEVQQRALRLQEEQKPWLVVASPPCTIFSTLQRLNFGRMTNDEIWDRLKEGVRHLAFQ